MAAQFVGITNDVDGWSLQRGSSRRKVGRDGASQGQRTYRGPAAGLADFLLTVPINGSDPEGVWSGFKIVDREEREDGPWAEVTLRFEGAQDGGGTGVEDNTVVRKMSFEGTLAVATIGGVALDSDYYYQFVGPIYQVEWTSETDRHKPNKTGASGISDGVVKIIIPTDAGSVDTPVKDQDYEIKTFSRIVESNRFGEYWRIVEAHWKQPVKFGWVETDDET